MLCTQGALQLYGCPNSRDQPPSIVAHHQQSVCERLHAGWTLLGHSALVLAGQAHFLFQKELWPAEKGTSVHVERGICDGQPTNFISPERVFPTAEPTPGSIPNSHNELLDEVAGCLCVILLSVRAEH